MVQLADIGIVRCEECGKLLQMEAGKQLCHACERATRGEGDGGVPEARPTVDHLEDDIREHAEQVMDELGIDTPKDAAEPHAPYCMQCNKNPAVEGANYCLACFLGMSYALGQAAKDVVVRHTPGFIQEEAKAHEPKQRSVAQALEEKMARTSTSRVSPNQEHKVK